ncbi:hypothetical protein EVAR_28819_1 [Eumeta japonica]|uniref:Uncharacterized protein n=1 Tax=Eumeta variegata TaxID=151549 RepID=A0A4C1WGW4_EUMVA|nr:hypothetical protein EVAR_28819_1 [Eumeta japonica]
MSRHLVASYLGRTNQLAARLMVDQLRQKKTCKWGFTSSSAVASQQLRTISEAVNHYSAVTSLRSAATGVASRAVKRRMYRITPGRALIVHQNKKVLKRNKESPPEWRRVNWIADIAMLAVVTGRHAILGDESQRYTIDIYSSQVVVCTMWRRIAMRKRLCDSLFTRFDGAVYYLPNTFKEFLRLLHPTILKFATLLSCAGQARSLRTAGRWAMTLQGAEGGPCRRHIDQILLELLRPPAVSSQGQRPLLFVRAIPDGGDLDANRQILAN